MSLCDRCFQPGACCQGFELYTDSGQRRSFWTEDPEGQLAAEELPFEVKELVGGPWVDPGSKRTYAFFTWSCPHLTAGGRCGVYQDRPYVCRDFAPVSSPLCVHYGGAEAGEDLGGWREEV